MREIDIRKADAITAWRAAHASPGEETTADLGVAVHRYATAADVPPAHAMKIVREVGEAEIASEANLDRARALLAEQPTGKPTTADRLAVRQVAVTAWIAAQESANGKTVAELGEAVRHYAQVAKLDPARAMKVVREVALAELDQKGTLIDRLPEGASEPGVPAQPEPEPGTPADARKAAWHELSQAFQADEHAPSEETAAALGKAAFWYASVAGMDHAAAVRKIREAVHGRGPKREIYVSYTSTKRGGLTVGSVNVTTTRRLVGLEDVSFLQEDLIGLYSDPSLKVLGWSTYDAPR